ncbi:MAG: hypothetical protein VX740_10105 [Pseudomonadota bacterium]|nr:hypothetical protein [Pseudomonadota bacterium]MED5423777.1 hypothetical protein [Pseudomonadota bacterium]
MSFLTNAFITAMDVEGNIAKIATSKIILIEGLCPPDEYQEYLEGEENRTKLHLQGGYTWETRETPEEISEAIYQAEIKALKELKKSRLPIPISADLFNALAAYKDEDGHSCYISIDKISQTDNEYSLQLVTSDGTAKSGDTLEDMMKSIEDAKQKRIKTLQQFCLGVV